MKNTSIDTQNITQALSLEGPEANHYTGEINTTIPDALEPPEVPQALAYSADPYAHYESRHVSPDHIAAIDARLADTMTITEAMALYHDTQTANPLLEATWIEAIGRRFAEDGETSGIITGVTTQQIIPDALLVIQGESENATPDQAVQALIKAHDLDPIPDDTRGDIRATLDDLMADNTYHGTSETQMEAVGIALQVIHNTGALKLEPLVTQFKAVLDERDTANEQSQTLEDQITATRQHLEALEQERRLVREHLATAESKVQAALETSGIQRRRAGIAGLLGGIIKRGR